MTEGRGSRVALQRRMLLLGMIPRYPRQRSAPELLERLAHRGLDVSLRTIERDLENLSLFLPLARDERTRPYGWYWTTDAPLQDVPAMDPETALTLCVLDEHAASLLPPVARARLAPLLRRAEEVLAAAGEHSGLRLWPERVRVLSSAPPLIPPAHSRRRVRDGSTGAPGTSLPRYRLPVALERGRAIPLPSPSPWR
jgi:hypothetical protein